jgi:hypothetical protein
MSGNSCITSYRTSTANITNFFLSSYMWVDFRQQEPEPMGQLIWGITGIKPQFYQAPIIQFNLETIHFQRSLAGSGIPIPEVEIIHYHLSFFKM